MTPHLTDTPVLETERLILRPPRAGDVDAWCAFFGSGRARFIGGGDDDLGRCWRAFATLVGHWSLRGCGPFVMQRRDTGAPIGSIGPWFPGDWPEREIGWTVWDEAAEGQGYAREAGLAVLDHIWRDLGWETAVSYIAHGNDRSVALAERLGAQLDDCATTPDDDPTYVYRHPHPGASV